MDGVSLISKTVIGVREWLQNLERFFRFSNDVFFSSIYITKIIIAIMLLLTILQVPKKVGKYSFIQGSARRSQRYETSFYLFCLPLLFDKQTTLFASVYHRVTRRNSVVFIHFFFTTRHSFLHIYLTLNLS